MVKVMKPVIAAGICFILAACSSQPEDKSGDAATTEVASQSPKVAPGKLLFMQCAACHSLDEGAPNKTGPNLHGVVGRKAGSVDGFKYSKALATLDQSWTREELDKFLTKPLATVPGTTMAFAGIADPEKRRQLIDYLESGDQKPAD